MSHAKNLLTDEARTAFFFVTLPESLPTAVITRFINWFHEFGIPVGGVVVNGVIQKDQVGKDAVEFVLNRIQMQDEHMGEIWKIFGVRVRMSHPSRIQPGQEGLSLGLRKSQIQLYLPQATASQRSSIRLSSK